jgi:hypothetical protein
MSDIPGPKLTRPQSEYTARMPYYDCARYSSAIGFIAGNLAGYFSSKAFTQIRAVDKKPLYECYLRVLGVDSPCLDCS